jgi:2-polyprenyl-6-methoxyphenol hydroxylase-like FAD-dependent oxidoreductase
VGRVLIVGAGIGGLVLALELHAIGRDCVVFEAAPSIESLGVGLNLQPYAVMPLHRLGLAAALREASLQPAGCIYSSRRGQILYREPLGLIAGFTCPQYSIHRASLHDILLGAVRLRMGEGAVQLGRRCVDFKEDGCHVTAHFMNGPSEIGDVLVACDGVHSSIFKKMHPGRPHVRQSGVTMWRGLTHGLDFLDNQSMLRGGLLPNGKLVVYPVRAPSSRADLVLNWVVELDAGVEPSSDPEQDRSWLETLFSGWQTPWLDIARMIRQASTIMAMPMTDRDPVLSWTAGRVTLLGDAAHPMFPLGSNGAGQAILDAEVLASCFSKMTDDKQALAEYEHARRPATEAIVLSDRNGGPDVVLDAIERRSEGQWLPHRDASELGTELAQLLFAYRQKSGTTRQGLSAL